MKRQLVPPILEVCFQLLHAAPEEADEEDEDDNNNPLFYAELVVSCLATEIPPEYLMPLLFTQVQAMIANADPRHRRAASRAAK